MDEKELRDVLKELKESNELQATYARRSYIMSIVAAVCCVLAVMFIFITALVVTPKLDKLYKEMDVTLQNVSEISQQLADANLDQLVNDVESLVADTQGDLGVAMDAIGKAVTAMDEALVKIKAIDVKKLNDAIKNLSDTVEPFANFFNKFK